MSHVQAAAHSSVVQPHSPCAKSTLALITVALAAITILGIVACIIKPSFVAANLTAFGVSTGIAGFITLVLLNKCCNWFCRKGEVQQASPALTPDQVDNACLAKAKADYAKWDGKTAPHPWLSYMEINYRTPEKACHCFAAMGLIPQDLVELYEQFHNKQALLNALKTFSEPLYWEVVALLCLKEGKIELLFIIWPGENDEDYQQTVMGLSRLGQINKDPEVHAAVLFLLLKELLYFKSKSGRCGLDDNKIEQLYTATHGLYLEGSKEKIKESMVAGFTKIEQYLCSEDGRYFLGGALKLYHVVLDGDPELADAVKKGCGLFFAMSVFDDMRKNQETPDVLCLLNVIFYIPLNIFELFLIAYIEKRLCPHVLNLYTPAGAVALWRSFSDSTKKNYFPGTAENDGHLSIAFP